MTSTRPIAFMKLLRRSGVAGVFVLVSLLPLLFNQVWVPIHLLTEHHTGSLLLAGHGSVEEGCEHPCQPGLDDFHFKASSHRDHVLSHEEQPAVPKEPVLAGYLVPGAEVPSPAPVAPAPTVPHRHHHPHPASDHDLVTLVALLIVVLACLPAATTRRCAHSDLTMALVRSARFVGRSRGPPAFAC